MQADTNAEFNCFCGILTTPGDPKAANFAEAYGPYWTDFFAGGVWRVIPASASCVQLYSGTQGNSRLPQKMKLWVF